MSIKNNGQSNGTLNKARSVKDDEFYTPMWLTKKFIDPFVPQLKGKKIICPCDGWFSNIYQYLRELGMDVKNDTQYEHPDYTQYDVVITNPPFSKMQDFITNYASKTKFLLISNWMTITNKWFTPYLDNVWWSNTMSVVFDNNPKPVRCVFLTTLDRPEGWHSENKECVEGQVYSMCGVDWFDRKDFATITQFKPDGKTTFLRLVYGKNNEWLINNVPDIAEISTNNYSKEYKRWKKIK